NRPNTLVLTKTIALKYFGTTDIIGETIKVFDPPQDYEVTAVIEDYPHNSHISFDILAPFMGLPLSKSPIWVSNNVYTYIKVTPNCQVEALDNKISEIVDKYVGPQFEQYLSMTLEELRAAGNKYGYVTNPVTEIHLKSNKDFEFQANGNLGNIYIFSVIALFLIIIASINFMNLATARSSLRSREVGLRKVVGSQRSHLIGQFLTESTILTLISFILAFVLVIIALPYFNDISNKTLNFELIDWKVFGPVLIGLLVFVSLLSGAYPAFFLASFSPIQVLKGKISAGMKSGWIRKILVGFQFFITISLVISTLLVDNQIRFILNKDLHFDKENLLIINRAYALGDQREAFIQELEKLPGVKSVGIGTQVPGGMSPGNTVFRKEEASNDELEPLNILATDYGYQEALGFKVISGRYFSQDFSSDSTVVILNEAAVDQLKWEEPIGKLLYQIGAGPNNTDLPMIVIGVVENYNYESLHEEIKPAIYLYSPNGVFCLVRYADGMEAEILEQISTIWDDLINQSFEYDFMDDQLKASYQDDDRMRILFIIFAALAVLIAIFGLLGLTSFSTERRKKEISIRKCLGSPVSSIISLLLKETVLMVTIASLIAWPVSWYFMNSWLQNFVFKTGISIWIFIIASLFAMFVAILTILYHVSKAARENPVNALKYD
ncbi:MAG: FtsX-like permease family protein, partial [Bacteroidales bacterium]|nr:FtsX-like permease family protein [Bacteroidales bacterium]